jgi:ABC-2 type transport system ATP-binding protein
MNDDILITKGLTKHYKKITALDDININIKRGKIYGLVGKNGAGKTTLMRIISGLAFPTSGTIELFGNDKLLEEKRKFIGSMIESPAFYPYMSARENLEAIRIGHGIPDKNVIDSMLEKVKLDDTGKKKVSNFSMGMKQRLGIAMTLLNSPKFLILDEPTNGLDPVSVVELRKLLIELAKDRMMTIMISSHALEQLYHLASDYIFMDKGKVIKIATKEELDSTCKKHIALQVNNAPLATTIIEKELGINQYRVMPDNSINIYEYVEDVQKVVEVLIKGNVEMKSISVKGDNIENYFLNLINQEVAYND